MSVALRDAPRARSGRPTPTGAERARLGAARPTPMRERRAARRGAVRRGRVLALALAVAPRSRRRSRWRRSRRAGCATSLGEAATARPRARASLGPLPGRAAAGLLGARDVDRARRTGRGCGSGRGRRRRGRRAGSTSPRGAGASCSAVAPDGPRGAGRSPRAGRSATRRWSPDGYRIAYRRDDALAVVAGDGTGARVLAAARAAGGAGVAPGRAAHAGLGRRGRPRRGRATSTPARSSGARRRRSARCARWHGRPTGAACSRAARGASTVFDVHGNRAWRVRAARAARAVGAAAWAPRGDRLALASARRASTSRSTSRLGAGAAAPGVRDHGHAALARVVARRPRACSCAGARPTSGSCSPPPPPTPASPRSPASRAASARRRPCRAGAAPLSIVTKRVSRGAARPCSRGAPALAPVTGPALSGERVQIQHARAARSSPWALTPDVGLPRAEGTAFAEPQKLGLIQSMCERSSLPVGLDLACRPARRACA